MMQAIHKKYFGARRRNIGPAQLYQAASILACKEKRTMSAQI